MRYSVILCVACLFVVSQGSLSAIDIPANPQYNRDVRPIFTKHCTSCHGGVKAAGNISFIYRDLALAEGKSGEKAIVPGEPDKSEMMRRVMSRDPEEMMPKPKHGPPLSAAETEILRRWIQQGAAWQELWSFIPPQPPPAPQLQRTDWPRSSFDAYVLAELERHQLKPSPEATKAEWLRRVSLDLIGLPPTPSEWQEFRDDQSTEAHAKVVDRLLGSQHFGERWATMWLDLARYSDTMGFEKDLPRHIWPYRDWLIRAFNADMPFDQFTQKQLAGDLLPEPTADDLIATAFHRNTQCNTEGGTNDEEFRVAAVLDRVNTTWTAWQATTFGCVQCHSHPYDPYPHDDYYRFMAFFNNTEDADLNDEFPKMKVTKRPEQQQESIKLEREIERNRLIINEQAKTEARSIQDFSRWKAVTLECSDPAGKLQQNAEGVFNSSGTVPTSSSYKIRFPAQSFGAIRLDILPLTDDPKQWLDLAAVVSEFKAQRIDAAGKAEPIKILEVIADSLVGPFDPNEAVRPGAAGFGDYPAQYGPRWCVFVPDAMPNWQAGDQLEIEIVHGLSCNADNQPCILKKFTLGFSAQTSLQTWIKRPERQQQWQQWQSLNEAYQAIDGEKMPIFSEREASGRRSTRVFARGNRMTREHEVTAGLPTIVGAPQSDQALTRLDLAAWLTSAKNPLTARVLANRLWAEMFGLGIVETQEDFGTSGTGPSNQDLLDHLALRLQGGDSWHIKPFLREIALSATYRQTSKASARLIDVDPRNRLLARGPRQRLSAEMIRDQALQLSGRLARQTFGPPVFPPQPDGIWKSVYNGASWKNSTGEDRYRRALYTFHKRTSGYPALLTFDAPARDVCSARRISTNTPLQALVTLNDPAFLELAQAMAKRMREQSDDLQVQLQVALEWITMEKAPASTIEALAELYHSARDEYQRDTAAAQALGETPDNAALVLVANTILNLDNSLTR